MASQFNLAEEFKDSGWYDLMAPIIRSDQYKKISDALIGAYQEEAISPRPDNIFRSLLVTPFDKTQVVIIGQDPYSGVNQANGLAFAVNSGQVIPPSLQRVFKEVESDLGIRLPQGRSSLLGWAEQGVLLLNSVLTVKVGSPGSHKKLGWGAITDQIIRDLSSSKENLVFLLWGEFAKEKRFLIDLKRHSVLEAGHPSPQTQGFLGCKHFSKTNDCLKLYNKNPINWSKIDLENDDELTTRNLRTFGTPHVRIRQIR